MSKTKSPHAPLRILCAVDFSGSADAAIEHAARLCRRLGGELHLVNAPPLPMVAFPEAGVVSAPYEAAEVVAAARENLGALAGHHPDLDVVPHVRLGPPSDVVLELIDELDVDYVVLGTHGRTGLQHLLLGSVAEQVVRRAPVPVLTVRPECRAAKAEASALRP
ncbi:MAG: universal stress protein [Myxococcota bacterium]